MYIISLTFTFILQVPDSDYVPAVELHLTSPMGIITHQTVNEHFFCSPHILKDRK